MSATKNLSQVWHAHGAKDDDITVTVISIVLSKRNENFAELFPMFEQTISFACQSVLSLHFGLNTVTQATTLAGPNEMKEEMRNNKMGSNTKLHKHLSGRRSIKF